MLGMKFSYIDTDTTRVNLHYFETFSNFNFVFTYIAIWHQAKTLKNKRHLSLSVCHFLLAMQSNDKIKR